MTAEQPKAIDYLLEISKFITTSKYSRYDEGMKRRELWAESADRTLSMHLKKYDWLSESDKKDIRWAFDQVKSYTIVPSMRSLQFGGKAIEAHNARAYNCFGVETQFVTSEGVKSFNDFKNGDAITVLTHTGKWKPAKVKSYGEQQLLTYSVVKGKNDFTVRSTENHNWILKSGEFKEGLSCGDILRGSEDIFSLFDYDTASQEEKLYWAYGLVYGDGTITDKKRANPRSMIRLCGFDKQYKDRFEELGFKTSTSQSLHGDFYAYTGTYLKTAPNPKIDPPNLIRAFVRGYLDADGEKDKNKNDNKFMSIQSSEDDHIEFIRNCFPIAGVFIISETDLTGQVTNFGVRPHTVLFRVRNNYPFSGNYIPGADFRVDGVSTQKETETVWCLEVEDDHSFVLKNGLTTGNCSVRHIDSLRSFAECFYLALCGVGVGIGVSKKVISRLPDLVNEKDKTGTVITYTIEDTIEGWADSIEALLQCYFKNTAYTGRKIVFDYSKIRKKGAALKTGGGKAPGYKGLKNAHTMIKNLLDHCIEYHYQVRIKPINVYDILMHTFDAVLSGGIRRSASICIFDLDDDDMMNAKTYLPAKPKNGVYEMEDKHGKPLKNSRGDQLFETKVQYNGKVVEVSDLTQYDIDKLKKEKLIFWKFVEPQRARSNNSVLLMRDRVTQKDFEAIIEKTKQFGEPGFVFGTEDFLCNPCVIASAPVLTPNGIKTFGDVLIGEKIWDGKGWTTVIKKWSTGIKETYRYETTAGAFYGTDNHRIVSGGTKIDVKDAKSIDSIVGPKCKNNKLNPQDIMDGLVLGDGTLRHKKPGLMIGKNDKDYLKSEVGSFIIKESDKTNHTWTITTTIESKELAKTYEREIPQRFFLGDATKVRGFLRGLYSANGSIVAGRISLKAASKKIIEQTQVMLNSIGIHSYFTTNRKHNVKFSNGTYECKESYDLNITTDRELFKDVIGFIQEYKNEKVNKYISEHEAYHNRKKNTFPIKKVVALGKQEVFDITVDNESHTFWCAGLNVSNCAEISFIPVTDAGVYGVSFCNLSSINGRFITSIEKFKIAVRAATIIGTLQAGYTDFPYLSKAAEELTKAEALLGVSITGFMDNPQILLDGKIQRQMAEYAVEINKEWAKKIKINPAARITCVKPEGTTSLVLGTGSGIHAHHARKYFRRVQCNKLDPVYKFFKKHNPHLCEESVWSANKTDDVVTFPIIVGDQAMIKSDLTALKHLEIIKETQKNWVIPGTTDRNKKNIHHNISCTIIVDEPEWKDVIKYLFDNREDFTAVSFIPKIGDKLYQQAPMEAVTTEEDEKKFSDMIAKMVPVDYTKMEEEEDNTALTGEAACAGGACTDVAIG